jgi:hypothetical protein
MRSPKQVNIYDLSGGLIAGGLMSLDTVKQKVEERNGDVNAVETLWEESNGSVYVEDYAKTVKVSISNIF